jgi:anti-anti-sigma regulatory factor
VHQIENQMTANAQNTLLLELALYAETERPHVVLNCSMIVNMNRNTIQLLLSCLEVAMKCNGDVRLAALPPAAEAVLRQSGITRLFEIHTTTEGAVQSFYQQPFSMAGMQTYAEASDRLLDYAA